MLPTRDRIEGFPSLIRYRRDITFSLFVNDYNVRAKDFNIIFKFLYKEYFLRYI